jgi:hypothetical protein
MQELAENLEFNPLNIFQNGDFKDCLERLMERKNGKKRFLGFGEGISALYLIFLKRYGLKETKDLVPKVDRHFMRLSVGTGVAEIKDGVRQGKLDDILTKLYSQICNEHGFDALFLDPTTWVIGHEVCSQEDAVACKMLCPLDRYCNKRLPIIDMEITRLYMPEKTRRKTPQEVIPLPILVNKELRK